MAANTRIERCVAIKFIVNRKEPLEAVVPIDDNIDDFSSEEVGLALKGIKASMAKLKESDPEFYDNIEDGAVLYHQFNRVENIRISGNQAEALLKGNC